MSIILKGFRRAVCLLAALALLAPACAFAEEADPTDEALRKIFRANRTSGAAVVVAKDGEIVYQYHYGFAAKRGKEPITDQTYFRIASVTKLVTGIHVMQLVEQGKLSLDADISDTLGFKAGNPYEEDTPVTLRMLMTHTSSISDNGHFPNRRRSLSSLITLDRFNKGNWHREVPGSKYRYSNFGAGIMGSLIEASTGLNVNDSITASLFQPLNISAAYSAGLLYNAAGAMYSSRNQNLKKEWDPDVNPEFHFRITVGSLWIRPTDLCRLGMMLCDGGQLEGRQVLQPETVAEMMALQQGRGAVTADTPYGLCIHHESTLVGGKMLYGHQGRSEGILCNLYYDPETRFVFVLCTNGYSNNNDNRVVKLTRKVFQVAWETFSGV